MLYETFAEGQQHVGHPKRPDFLLRPGELLEVCQHLHIVAYENGYLSNPPRFVQHIAAIKPHPRLSDSALPPRYALSLK